MQKSPRSTFPWLPLALTLGCGTTADRSRGAGLLGCSAERAEPSSWARSVAEKHAAADALLARGERDAAERELEEILASAPTHDPSLAPDAVRILLQDTRYRLARLALDDGRLRDAVQIASAGLALGGDDLYLANLLVARGAALESLSEGDAALADYGRALTINERLLHQTLEAAP